MRNKKYIKLKALIHHYITKNYSIVKIFKLLRENSWMQAEATNKNIVKVIIKLCADLGYIYDYQRGIIKPDLFWDKVDMNMIKENFKI